ncbi:pyridoxamine 5'-phosphate oxidase family protein [Rhizobium sp. YIM 134829]|uniref:pyridoxamine 5'-phosphate oxidase family protein n=1 Tax=Rhizobium sp. YIM 134829 TaxID=3390453 RepID=UPI00397B1ED3
MSRAECAVFLREHEVGSLGCIYNGKPYVVPIRFVFDEDRIYSFSLPGEKIESMRQDPQVCIQVYAEETAQSWKSVLVRGTYHELPDDEDGHSSHMRAWSLLQKRGNWWEPGAYKPDSLAPSGTSLAPIFYQIQVEQISGRIAAASD